MILIKELPKKLLLICVVFFVFSTTASSQKEIQKQSFKENRGNYDISYAQYFYQIKAGRNNYRLINKKGQDIFNEAFDTIVKNTYFIKTQRGDLVSIYRTFDLEKIEIPNLIQAYFMRDGLDVLTTDGAQYYDNAISKIDNFPTLEFFKCGTVYSKSYSLKYNESAKKYNIEVSEGDLGVYREETILNVIGLPDNVESIRFLSNKKYTSVSVNNDYEVYPNIIKIVKDGKSGLYSYDLEEAIYPKKKKQNDTNYIVNEVTLDTLIVLEEPSLLTKKGSIIVKEVLPITFDKIQQSPINGLVYLYKDKKKGIYPHHTQTDFTSLDEKTRSFYSINKNGKWGWIDLKTFKEYYFKQP